MNKRVKRTGYRRIRMQEKYLQKDTCMERAKKLIEKNGWTKITDEQLAKEIYGHAYVCYRWQWISKLPIANRLIYIHAADGIDVTDKRDAFWFVWEWIWKL